MKKFIYLAVAVICIGLASCSGDEPEMEKGFTLGSHESVDLGLPSGVHWATCNIGASSPYEFGSYFAWGETTPKNGFEWGNYKYWDGAGDFTKYSKADGKTILEPGDDAAIANWGTKWRIPTTAEFTELAECCTWEWKNDYNGVNGYLVIGPNGNSIFLPAAGYNNGVEKGVFLWYWSTSVFTKYFNNENAYALMAVDFKVYDNFSYDRYNGLPIRPVMDK